MTILCSLGSGALAQEPPATLSATNSGTVSITGGVEHPNIGAAPMSSITFSAMGASTTTTIRSYRSPDEHNDGPPGVMSTPLTSSTTYNSGDVSVVGTYDTPMAFDRRRGPSRSLSVSAVGAGAVFSAQNAQ